MRTIAERLVRGVTAAAEAGGWTFMGNLVALNVNDGEVALNAQ